MSSNRYPTTPVRSLRSRFCETERDLEQMQDLLMEARSRTDDWRYWHVGELMFALGSGTRQDDGNRIAFLERHGFR